MGGLLMMIGGILEWVLGNTFASVVFTTFGAFWLSFAGTLVPSFNAYGAYASPDAPVATGLATQGFNASLGKCKAFKEKLHIVLTNKGFWLLSMGMICLIFLVCALRTNAVFVLIFFTLVLSFSLQTGSYWALAMDYTGNASIAGKCRVVSGSFGCCVRYPLTVLGCWCMCFRNIHGGMVPAHFNHARRRRLPAPITRWRLDWNC